MKICAVIAEYNPLHSGHIRQLNYIKEKLGAEKIIVILSGNFTQRGEPAVLNKYTRAKHAVICGADLVIELPTVFATGNAETFAYGAIKLINSLGIVDGICFGVESGTKEDYLALAEKMNDESKEFKKILRDYLDKGYSLCKAKYETVKTLGGDFDESLISSPNNVLALEYTKALLKLNSEIEIYPLLRQNGHNDVTLKKSVTSAKSIREVIRTGKKKLIKRYLHNSVFKDIKPYPKEFDKIILTSAITADVEDMANLPDCTEGLENRIKALLKDNKTLDRLLSKVVTKRYTESRIRRILTCNLLHISRDFVATCLDDKLYAKVLAIKKGGTEILSQIIKNCETVLLTRKSDKNALSKTALKCFNIDVLANDLYNLVADEKNNEYQMITV